MSAHDWIHEQNSRCSRVVAGGALAIVLSLLHPGMAFCGDTDSGAGNLVFPGAPARPLKETLPAAKWRQMEDSVDRALAWLATQQSRDGSFPTIPSAQPAVTSLCVLAYLSRGDQPGYGPYGEQLDRAIDFVISCQKPDGLFCYDIPGEVWQSKEASHTAVYNHAIAGLMLGEVYGHVTGQRTKDVKLAIEKALQFTRALQTRPKYYPDDFGGWRYLRLRYNQLAADSDMSVTSWQLMFLRSARNAEFDVPRQYIEDAMQFIHRSFDPQEGYFHYTVSGNEGRTPSRGLVGAGILSLALAGEHQTPMALQAGDWLLAHPYRGWGDRLYGGSERFLYSTYYVSQAAAQLGGHYWQQLYTPLVNLLLANQFADGSWPVESGNGDNVFGNSYSTAMAVLTLTPAYQLLPVYQR